MALAVTNMEFIRLMHFFANGLGCNKYGIYYILKAHSSLPLIQEKSNLIIFTNFVTIIAMIGIAQ